MFKEIATNLTNLSCLHITIALLQWKAGTLPALSIFGDRRKNYSMKSFAKDYNDMSRKAGSIISAQVILKPIPYSVWRPVRHQSAFTSS